MLIVAIFDHVLDAIGVGALIYATYRIATRRARRAAKP